MYSQGTKIMIDLHGKSVKEVKLIIQEELTKAAELRIDEIYFITGRGNHVNASGSRGVLKKILPNLLQPYCQKIIQINKEIGAYKIILKPNQELSNLKHILTSLFAESDNLIKVIENIKQSADSNNIEAMLSLAFIYLYQIIPGFGGVNDGINLLEKARTLDSVEAALELAILYHEGVIVKQKHEKAFRIFRNLAENKNHPIAQYYLAACYLHGKGVKYNDEEAVYWMKKSADQNDMYAEDCLGDFYLLGKITQQNFKLGIAYKTKAAEQGFADAQIDLGRCYATGYGVKQDYQTAFKWYFAAAQFNHPYALFQVGTYLLEGRIGVPSPKEAFIWFLKAAELGDGDGEAQVARQYLFGEGGIRQNIQEGLKWAEKSSEKKNKYGYYVMAKVYLKGIGVKKDDAKAYEFMQLSADAGYQKAAEKLKVMLVKKERTPSKINSSVPKSTLFKPANESKYKPAEKAYEHIMAIRLKNLLLNSSPDKALIQAALYSSLDDVIVLLKNGANPNIMVNDYFPVNFKCSLLHMMVQKGYQPMVKILLEAGAKPNVKSEREMTPLSLVLQNSTLATQELLLKLEQNPDINQVVDKENNTPLLLALKLGQYDLAASFVEKGAHLFDEDNYENNALDLCPSEEREKILSAGSKAKQLRIDSESLQKLSNSKGNQENKTSLWNPGFKGLKSHAMIKSCLTEHCDLEEKNPKGDTPLLAASRAQGNFKLLFLLIKAGADSEARDKSGKNLLQIIQMKSYPPEKKAQIEKAIGDAKLRKSSGKVLAFAVLEGYYNLVQFGLTHGENIDQRIGKNQETPLMFAVRNKHLFIAKLLIDKKADITLKNKQGQTAIQLCEDINMSATEINALFGEAYKIEEKTMLLNPHSPKNLALKTSQKEAPTLPRYKEVLPKQPHLPSSKATASQQLLHAIKTGNVALVEQSIQAGVDINTLLVTGQFPLFTTRRLDEPHSLYSTTTQSRYVEAQPEFGESPLYLASSLGQLTVVDCLLRLGANVNQADNYGLTALIVAISEGHIKIAIRLLAEPAIDVNHVIQDKSSALSIACEKGATEVVEVLLAKGAPVKQADDEGETPLIIAITHQHRQLIPILLKAGANPNQCKLNGVSPLFLAAQLNQLEIMKQLIACNADIEIKRKTDGVNALMVAVYEGHAQVVSYLLACGANLATTSLQKLTAIDYAKQCNRLELWAQLLEYQKNQRAYLKENVPLKPHFFQPSSSHQQTPDAIKLQTILSCFKAKEETSLPTVELALRRAAAGLRPGNDAGMEKQTEIISYLLTHVQDINAISPSNGMTALHLAVINGQIDNIKLLLDSGANPEIGDKNQKTAKDYALVSSDEEIRELFNNVAIRFTAN